MALKIFLDATLLLDFTLKRDHYQTSMQIIELAVSGYMQAFITPSIVHITGYWLGKAYGSAKAKELLLYLLADMQVIEISHENTINALHSKINDIEDALQYYTALQHKLDYFISRDKSLQKIEVATLPVYSPEFFLKEIV